MSYLEMTSESLKWQIYMQSLKSLTYEIIWNQMLFTNYTKLGRQQKYFMNAFMVKEGNKKYNWSKILCLQKVNEPTTDVNQGKIKSLH